MPVGRAASAARLVLQPGIRELSQDFVATARKQQLFLEGDYFASKKVLQAASANRPNFRLRLYCLVQGGSEGHGEGETLLMTNITRWITLLWWLSGENCVCCHV